MKNKKIKIEFEESVSPELKDKIFKNVSPLMQSYAKEAKSSDQMTALNKIGLQVKSFFSLHPVSLSVLSLCFVCLVGLHFFNKNSVDEFYPASFQEIAALSPDDLLVVQNLDLIETLDELSPEELKELEREIL